MNKWDESEESLTADFLIAFYDKGGVEAWAVHYHKQVLVMWNPIPACCAVFVRFYYKRDTPVRRPDTVNPA